jgi:hypothetical protein
MLLPHFEAGPQDGPLSPSEFPMSGETRARNKFRWNPCLEFDESETRTQRSRRVTASLSHGVTPALSLLPPPRRKNWTLLTIHNASRDRIAQT